MSRSLKWARLGASPPSSLFVWRYGLLVALVVFLVDLFTKQAVLTSHAIAVHGGVSVLPFMDIVLKFNSGISFGLGQQDGYWGRIGLEAFNVGVALAIVMWLRRCGEVWTGLGLALLIGGALGNAVDRFVYGAVVDFVYLHAGSFHWYVFNVADVGIVLGVPCLLMGIWRPRPIGPSP